MSASPHRRRSQQRSALALLASGLLLTSVPALARTLQVGPNAEYRSLGTAVAKAGEGDTINLAPGSYFECAVITVRGLTLQGAGDTTEITDRTCVGKALLVADADNLTVRDLVLTRARVADMNGAGIRLEAHGLVLERVRLINNQIGVLAGLDGPGEIRITDCTFRDGGVAGERPSAALTVGSVGRLVVENSTFSHIKGGQISSGAQHTELVGNRIETGLEPGAGNAVMSVNGALVMRDNVLVLGPNPPPRDAAIIAYDGSVELHHNRLENTTGQHERLLLDWTHGTPVLDANVVPAGDEEVATDGVLRHRAGIVAREAIGDAHALAGATKQALKRLVGR